MCLYRYYLNKFINRTYSQNHASEIYFELMSFRKIRVWILKVFLYLSKVIVKIQEFDIYHTDVQPRPRAFPAPKHKIYKTNSILGQEVPSRSKL